MKITTDKEQPEKTKRSRPDPARAKDEPLHPTLNKYSDIYVLQFNPKNATTSAFAAMA
tara:strand:+ start:2591 stop:2764 length:174 start_codon:yes stop_codon:yes gene_type:complete